MYDKDDSSYNKEVCTLKQFREVTQNIVNTTERRNVEYQKCEEREAE